MSDYHPNLDGPAEPIGLAMDSQQIPAQSELASARGSLALPALNDDIKEILSMMPWNSARIARRLDELKIYEVKRKCEEEQAAAMHWMLNLYLTHGKEWRAAGEKILKAEAPENDSSSATVD